MVGHRRRQRQRRAPLRDAGAVNHATPVVVRWLEAGDRGDVDQFDDLLHVDAVIHAPRGLSTDSRDAEKSVWLAAIAAMPDLRHEVQEVIVQDDVEMARVVVTGTLVAEFGGIPGSNKAFTMDQAVICHLRAGKIAEAWEIADVGSLSDQVT
jgi:ketosteroid isomerase-like protein